MTLIVLAAAEGSAVALVVGSVTLTIAIVQTIIGLIGVPIAGRQAAKIVRHTEMRAVPRKI